jgi:DNA polymerase elongation subunit (family B)
LQPLNNLEKSKRIRGWILDVYPSAPQQMSVWIITEDGQRIQLMDEFKQTIYVSDKENKLESIFYKFGSDSSVESCRFAQKYATPNASTKSQVLEVTLKDYQKTSSLVRRVLQANKYLRYRVHNCDLKPPQVYFYERDIFPLAFVEVEVEKNWLKYSLLDSAEKVDYPVPPLKITRLNLKVNKNNRLAQFNEPLEKAVLSSEGEDVILDSGEEGDKLLQIVETISRFDPDIILTRGGDSFVFPYLARRALVNSVLERLVLSRDGSSLMAERKQGRSYFSYGRTFYRAPTRRLYGRVHIDESNTFILRESDIEGLIEIARSCRVPLHRAARSSIGTSMSSLQNCQAVKDDYLVPRNKHVGETFKSAYSLLVGDRGGFVYEPRMGIHEGVGEVDFSSMYPSLMAKYNISAETVLCECCPDSRLRIPELGFNICEKRRGIVPKVLEFAVTKRLRYKKLVKETKDEELREIYDKRQSALKWILVTCFGYLGYKNAKFGTVDGHIGVCAFGRDALLNASHISEDKGFSVIHGIVDSLWLKKNGASSGDYIKLSQEIVEEMDLPLDFAGLYKWIVFLPSKTHPNVPVLNRYYGVKEDGSVKIRGLDVRRRDTPRFVCDAQIEMINALASAEDSKGFVKKIPEALNVVKEYRKKLLNGEVPVWDLVVTKRLSKKLEDYTQKISQVIAGEQLRKEGIEVSAGKSVKFLFTSAKNKRHIRRVKAKELINEETSPDLRKYLLLLYASASNILSPFGYSQEIVKNYANGHKYNTLLGVLGKHPHL